jgi:hypothetical protein
MDENSGTSISEKSNEGNPKDRSHVVKAFEQWGETLHGKLSDEDAARVQKISEAAHQGDSELVQKHLEDTKEHSNWLYTELMKHPAITEIMQELSIMGF